MMGNSGRRVAFAAIGLGAGAILLSGPGTSCTSFLSASALTAADFCFIFDCENGLFGGTLDPCPPGGFDNGSGQLPLFLDCPDLQQP
jgi:hypothetical protein